MGQWVIGANPSTGSGQPSHPPTDFLSDHTHDLWLEGIVLEGGVGGRKRGGGRWNSGGMGPIQCRIPVGRKSWCRSGWRVGGMDVMEGGRRTDDGRVPSCLWSGGGVGRGKRGGGQ